MSSAWATARSVARVAVRIRSAGVVKRTPCIWRKTSAWTLARRTSVASHSRLQGRVGDVEQDLVLELCAREGGHVSATQFVNPRRGLVVEVGRGARGPLLGEVPEADAPSSPDEWRGWPSGVV